MNVSLTSSEADSDDDDHTDKDEEADTPRSTASSAATKKHRKHKTKNGKYPVDMTPPDKHLRRAEKKIKKYARHKRVSAPRLMHQNFTNASSHTLFE